MSLSTRLRSAVSAFASPPGTEPKPENPSPDLQADGSVPVASGYPFERYFPYYVNPLYAIPPIDDLIEQKGLAVYREMMDRDEAINSTVWLTIFARLSTGYEVVDASDDPADAQIGAFVRHTFDALEKTSLTRVLSDAMDALPMGFSIQEPIWREPYTEGEFAGLQCYRTIRPIPQETITFKRDEMGELEPDGVWQSIPPIVVPSRDPAYFRKLQADRFMIWNWRQRWGNPLGQSILRPAWRWYIGKERMVASWLRYIEMNGLPKVEAAIPDDKYAALKAQVLAEMEFFQTSQRLVRRKSVEITSDHPPQHAAAAQVYESFVNVANRSIARCVLQPSLLLENTQVGSFALGESHRDTWELVLENIGLTLADEFMREQFIGPLVRHNFGPSVALPSFTFKAFREQDRQIAATVFQILTQLGVAIPVQYIRKALSIPEPKEGEEVTEKTVPPAPFGAQSPGDAMDEIARGDEELMALLKDMHTGARDVSGDGLVEAIRGNGHETKKQRGPRWQ